MSTARRIRHASVAALAVAVATANAATAPPPARAQVLTPYVLVDQWPRGNGALEALIADPQGLDVDAEDRAFVSDRTAGGVVTLLPNGDFLPPFGATGTGPERLASPGRLAVDQERGRVYVLDRGTDRVVVYNTDGAYQTAWPTAAVAIAVGPDGTVYTAGSAADEITAFTPDGSKRWTYGMTGSADGQFVQPVDIGVDAEGKAVAVSDLDGYRVQLFDVGAGGLRFRRSIDLSQSKYNRYRGVAPLPLYFRCHADVVQPLGDDAVWVGDGTGACILEADTWRYTIASVAGDRSLCKLTVRLPRLRPSTGQFLALATHDPNVGPCFSAKLGIDVMAKDTRLPTSPAVVRYGDLDLRAVTSLVLASGDRDPHHIVGPQRIDIPVPGRVFVQDASLNLHTLDQDGAPLTATPKRDAWQISQPFRTFVDLAAGSPVDGEVFAYYRRETRERDGSRWTWEEREHGLDRFRGVPQQVRDRTVDVIASVWPERRAWTTRSPEALAVTRLRSSHATGYYGTVDLAYNGTVDEVVVLVREQTETGVDEVARLMALRGDGTGPLRRTPLPGFSVGTAEVSGYVDLDVGPDGRVYALDDLADRVVAFSAAGARGDAVAVAPDARAVAGGPDSAVFTLGAGGYVEGRRADGVLTARFDARPLMGADPSTLTGLEVDDAGRVYVADALSSIVSVYAPGDVADAVPDGATCVAQATKVAAPARVAVGDAVDVALTLGGACGAGEAPADIVIVAPQIIRIRSDDRLRWELETAARLHRLLGHIARLDLRRHRVGLVTFAQGATTTLPLTHDRDALLAAIRRMNTDRTFADPTGIKTGLSEAGQLFDPDDGRPDVVLVVEANYCSLDLASPGLDGWYCNTYPRAEEAAAALRERGVRIVVAETAQAAKPYHSAGEYEWHAATLATSSDDVVGFGQSAHARIVETIVPPALGTDLVLTDTLPANMAIVTGSPRPSGATVAGTDVVWSQAELPFGPTTFRLQVRPQQVGRWPTNVRAVAAFTDAWGVARSVSFPIPEVDVVAGPSPTAPPTATVRATDEPTPGGAETPGVPEDRRIFLPIARCDRPAGR